MKTKLMILGLTLVIAVAFSAANASALSRTTLTDKAVGNTLAYNPATNAKPAPMKEAKAPSTGLKVAWHHHHGHGHHGHHGPKFGLFLPPLFGPAYYGPPAPSCYPQRVWIPAGPGPYGQWIPGHYETRQVCR